MMPRCPIMTSYRATWATTVDAVKTPVCGKGLNTALGAATVDTAEVLESKITLHLGFLFEPCAHVIGATMFLTNMVVGTRAYSVDFEIVSNFLLLTTT